MMKMHEYHTSDLRIEIKVHDPRYDIHVFTSKNRSISIVDPHNDQFPVALIIQLVEQCSGIAEVRV